MSNWTKVLLGLIVVVVALALIFGPQYGVVAQTTSVTLDWTAPGDDGNVGTASTYEMKFSTVVPDTTNPSAMDAWWAGATSVTNLPNPQVAGTAQSVVVSSAFSTGATYYFVMKACDEVPNCSGYSNVASKFIPDNIPPSSVTDLRTR